MIVSRQPRCRSRGSRNSWTASSTRAARCRLATNASGAWASPFDPCVTRTPCHMSAVEELVERLALQVGPVLDLLAHPADVLVGQGGGRLGGDPVDVLGAADARRGDPQRVQDP